MKTLLPIVFILIAGAIFFGFIDPSYKRVQTLRVEEARFDQALTRSRELQQTRDQLLSRYNTLSPNDIDRLEKLLPDNIDNVRLILDLDTIASQFGMRVRNISISAIGPRVESGRVDTGSENGFGTLMLSFSVTTTYEKFRTFLESLERSLRLVDVTNVSFASVQSGLYDYQVSIKTYWLKP